MNKIALLIVGVILAVGLIGVGYALWDKDLIIHGQVSTGEVNAIFIDAYTDDDGVVNDPTGGNDCGDDGTYTEYSWWMDGSSSDDPMGPGPCPDRYTKDVGRCWAIIDQSDNQILHVGLENAYPSYWNTIWYTIVNNGTVPVVVNDFGLYPANFTPGVEVDVFWCGTVIGDQIDPGETRDGMIQIHVLQPAAENAIYSFDADIWLVQWNEYPYVGPRP
jgi:hypothetical protein